MDIFIYDFPRFTINFEVLDNLILKFFQSYFKLFSVFLKIAGTSGSGKSHASMLLLRQLFAVAGGGPETDAFKHLAAAFTVLRSLGSAKTSTNSESSRIVSLVINTFCNFMTTIDFIFRDNLLKSKLQTVPYIEPKFIVTF